jgi:outer membrane protein
MDSTSYNFLGWVSVSFCRVVFKAFCFPAQWRRLNLFRPLWQMSRMFLHPRSLALTVGFASLTVTAQNTGPGQGSLLWQDAVEQALRHNNQIRIQAQRLPASEGQLEVARAAFDPVVTLGTSKNRDVSPLNNANRQSLGRDALVADRFNFNASVERQLRTGMSWQAFSEWSHLRDQNNLNFLSPGAPSGSIGFTVETPLGRGRGEEEVGATERIANQQVLATRADVAHQVTLITSDVLQQYWLVRAQEQYLQLARDIEARSERGVEQIRRLIAKEQVPAAELNLVEATRLDKVRQRVQAEQALREARTRLARLTGQSATDGLTMGPTASDFPSVESSSLRPASTLLQTLDSALQERLDLQAERTRLDMAREAVRQSTLRTRPDINLGLTLRQRFVGEDASAWDAINSPYNTGGPSVLAQLNYRWPVNSRQVQGELKEKIALNEQQSLRVNELRESIEAEVRDQWFSMTTAAAQVATTDQAVLQYEGAVQAERRRYALGMTTLGNVLQQEDRLDAAQQQRIQQRQLYTSALVRLWSASGRLVAADPAQANGYRLQADFQSLPTLGRP